MRGEDGLLEAIDHCMLWTKRALPPAASADGNTIDETKFLVVIDQFEEIFRFSEAIHLENAIDFIDLLLHIKRLKTEGKESPAVYVVLTMRTDHLGDCARIPRLADAINETFFLTPDLKEPQIEEAIVGPLGLYGATIDEDAVTQITDDIRHLRIKQQQSDYLPLMQHTLMRMWLRARRRDSARPSHLTLEDYQTVGGVAASLANHADEALSICSDAVDATTPDEQARVRAFVKVFFQCLTERRHMAFSQDVRRPVAFKEVTQVAGWTSDADQGDAKKIKLCDERS